jgi:peptidoglycan/LPS O-acetylase OafA/YrhL
MKYRPEIDGLRAVAVVPVVLFHAGFSVFSGGYVGVDVFFVISGYLITTILMNDLSAGRFSSWGFYERRARRILPALLVVIFACIPFAWMWMLPAEFKDFSQSIVAVSLFASNILFWQESGYFAATAEVKPLLHTWSLAVEEQYYLLFPLFLFSMRRFGREYIFWILVAISLISFVLCEWGWRNWPEANFYLTPMRAWELFSGSLAAMIVLHRGVQSRDFLASAGLVGIGISILVFDAQTPFPSAYTLLPVGSVMLIILFGGAGTVTARVLSNRLMIAIGLISYSLYLWHQPLFAFARMRMLHEPDRGVMVALCVCAVGLAYLTWRFVEQPFRANGAILIRRQDLFIASTVGLLGFAVFGAWGHLQNGAQGRLSDEVTSIMAAKAGDSSGCHNSLTAKTVMLGETCVIGRSDIRANIAIIGDSHASRITDALAMHLDKMAMSAITFNASWCAPLMHFGTDVLLKSECTAFVDAALTKTIENSDIRTVILFAEWANYTKGMRFGDENVAAYTFDNLDDTGDVSQNPIAFDRAMEFTFRKLKQAGKNVVLVSPTPEYQFHVPQSMAKVVLFNQSVGDLPRVTKAGYLERNKEAIHSLREHADRFGFSVLNAYEVFCAAQNCMFHNEKFEALYEDSNHLNFAGASMLVSPLMDMILR